MYWVSAKLRYSTRTPATDMLYNTTDGRAHNNSTTCCATNLPHRNARAQHLVSRHVKMLGCGKFLSVGGEFVVQQVAELLQRVRWWCCTTCP